MVAKLRTWIGKHKLASIGLGIVGLVSVCCVCAALLVAISPPDRDSGEEAQAPVSTRPTRTQAVAVEPSTATPRPTDIPEPTARDVYQIGETIAAGDWNYTVTGVEYAKELVWSDFGNKDEAKGIYVVVYLTLKNVGQKNYSNRSSNYTLEDDSGVVYEISNDFSTSMWLSHKELANLRDQFPPGLAVETALVYDINPEATGLKLHWNDLDVDVLLDK